MNHKITIYQKQDLTAKIKGLALSSRQLRKKIKDAFTKDKETFWLINSKIHLGSLSRHHLLAYALMRGKSYSKLELKCRENNKPNPEMILNIIQLVLFKSHFLQYWNLERVVEWLNNNSDVIEVSKLSSKSSFLKQLFSTQASN